MNLLGQGNDVVLRPKIGKIVINPIQILINSIRAPEAPLLLFALESMEKVFFGPHPSGLWEFLNISVKCHLCSLILGMWGIK